MARLELAGEKFSRAPVIQMAAAAAAGAQRSAALLYVPL